MPIPITCACGKALDIPEKYAGKRIKCPGCGAPVSVPRQQTGKKKPKEKTEEAAAPRPRAAPAAVPAAAPAATPPPPAMVRFTCACGKQMQARLEYAGRTTRCPGCGKHLPIPEESEPAATPANGFHGGKSSAAAPSPPTAPEPAPATISEAATAEKPPDAGPPPATAGQPPEPDSAARTEGTTGRSSRKRLLIVSGLLVLVVGGVGAGWFLTGGLAPSRPGEREEPSPEPEQEALRPAGGEAGQASQGNLKQIGDAMMEYHQKHHKFPPAAVPGKDGKPLRSWRVELLPFLDEKELYDQVKKDEPWDSPANKALWGKMPKVFALPDKPAEPGQTYYQVFTGPRALFGGKLPPKLADISDSRGQTILIAEAARPVNWMSPQDLPFELRPAGYAPDTLGGHFGNAFHVYMADRTVRRVERTVNPKAVQAAITPAGRDDPGPDWEAAVGR